MLSGVRALGALVAVALLGGCGGSGDGSRRSNASPSAPGATSASGCARPYSPNSPWNTPIGSRPRYDLQSRSRLARLDRTLTSDPTQYTYPVYEVGAGTPRRPVQVDGVWSNVVANGQRLVVSHGARLQLPVPQGAGAAAGSDAQIVIVRRSTGDEWGAWQLRRSGRIWRAENAYHYNVRWSGVPPSAADGRPFGSRGAGVPYLAGLVRPCEIRRGRIDHALAFAYDAPSARHVYPATKSDGQGSGPSALPEGTRLQLDPRLSAARIRRWGCRGACLVAARALQRYGMYVIDNSGRPKVMFEYEGTARWRGAIHASTVSAIPMSAFRVLRGSDGS